MKKIIQLMKRYAKKHHYEEGGIFIKIHDDETGGIYDYERYIRDDFSEIFIFSSIKELIEILNR
jgi:hypothetical protein